MTQARPWKIATLILAALFIVSFFVPNEALQAGNSDGADEAIAGDVVLADTSDDPAVNLVILSDATCVVCDSTNVKEGLSTYFPTIEIKELDVSSKTAKNLIKRFDLKAVPAFVFDKAITKTANYDKIQEGLEQKEGVYLVRPEVTGVGKLLDQPSLDGFPVKGERNAPVQIIEFSDFECPFCKKFFDETYPQIVKDYVNTGKASIAFRHLPLDFHENALPAAMASLCANEQGKFWEYHDQLFSNQNALDKESLVSYANKLGLDQNAFTACLNDNKHGAAISADKNYAASVGISGTPSFVINGMVIGGAQPYELFKAVIDAELAQK